MNRPSNESNRAADFDPLATVDPFASYDPELTSLLNDAQDSDAADATADAVPDLEGKGLDVVEDETPKSGGGEPGATMDGGPAPGVGELNATMDGEPAPGVGELSATMDGGPAPGVGGLDATMDGTPAPGGGGLDATMDGTPAPGGGGLDATLDGVPAPGGGGFDATLDGAPAPGGGGLDATMDGTPAPGGGGFDATLDGAPAPGGGGLDATMDGTPAPGGGGFDATLDGAPAPGGGGLDATMDGTPAPGGGGFDATLDGAPAPGGGGLDATMDGTPAPGVGGFDATLDGAPAPGGGGLDATMDGTPAPGVGGFDATLDGAPAPGGGGLDATMDGTPAPGGGGFDATLDGVPAPGGGGFDATLDGAPAPGGGGFDATMDGVPAPEGGGLDATMDGDSVRQPTPLSATLDDQARSQITDVCVKFESAWEHDEKEPSVEEFVPKDLDPDVRQSLVRQLVLVDIKYRKSKHKSLSSVDYLSRLPECREAVESVFSKPKSNLPAGYGSVAVATQSKSRRSKRPVHADDPTTRYPPTDFLARGGLGCVFHAQDAELNRLVALKEILPDHADNERLQEKFLFEAEVTGSLEHPGIVPVYGLGRYEDNQPYYAMRFIRGNSFQDVIEDFHKEHAPLTSSTFFDRDFRGLLRRLIDACNAMHYAHVHGVLHRDIKPDNIMIGSFGETLVVDWGLAKLVEVKSKPGEDLTKSTLSSLRGSGKFKSETGVSGTPMYMSPEQAAGRNDRLDGRTDVYSLGAVLFYIVSANCAVTGKTARDVITNVRLGKTVTVDVVAPAAPKALASICRKAMALERDDRYQTAVELGEDIDRWMSDEVVLAHIGHETLIERAGRLIRKNRGLTMSIAASLVVITVVALVAALLINSAKNREIIARENEETAKKEAIAFKRDAVDRYRDSRDAIDTWLVQSSSALEFFPGAQKVRERLLVLATKDYAKLAESKSDDPELELERGRALVKIGDLYEKQLNYEKARTSYGEALKAFETDSDDEELALFFRSEHGNVHAKLGVTFSNEEKNAEAQEEFSAAIEELTKLAEETDDPLPRRFLAAAHANAGELDWHLGKTDLAIDHLEEGMKQYGLLGSASDSTSELGIARTQELLGRIYRDLGEQVKAMTFFNEAINGLQPLVDDEPDHPEYFDALASAYNSQASTFRTRGLETQLLNSLETSVGSYRALLKTMPDMPHYRANLAITLTNFGLALHESGANVKAEPLLEEAYEILNALDSAYGWQVPEYRYQRAKCLDVIGQVYLDTKEDPGAVMKTAEASVAQQIQDAVTDEDRIRLFPELAIVESHLARTYQRQNEPAAAKQTFEAAQKRLEGLIRIVGDRPAYANVLAHIHYRHALLLHEQSDDQAVKHFETARDLWTAIEPRAASYTYDLAWLLAICPLESVRDAEASLQFAKEAVELAPENPHYLATQALATVLNGQADEATALLEQSKSQRGHWIDRDFFVLAMAQKLAGKPEEARQSLAEAIKWMNENRSYNADMKLLRAMTESRLEE